MSQANPQIGPGRGTQLETRPKRWRTGCLGQVAVLGEAGAAPSGTAAARNQLLIPGETPADRGIHWGFNQIGAQTILGPRRTTSGFEWTQDQTDAEGAEFNPGLDTLIGESYLIGTDPAFYVKGIFTPQDVSGIRMMLGFRKIEAHQADFNDYTDLCAIGIRDTDVDITTILANAATVETDTTDNGSDGTEITYEVRVSSGGVVTFLVNGVTPTTVVAYTFTSALRVMPFLHILQSSDLSTCLGGGLEHGWL